MSDIFISYAKQDRPSVEPLAAALEAQGWSVFWDREILAGRNWRSAIDEALNESRSVVVAWSQAAVESSWVAQEAEVGREKEILVPILLQEAEVPLGFRESQALDLSQWDGTPDDGQFKSLAMALERLLRVEEVSWDEFLEEVVALRGLLNRSPRRGGFHFDVILGVTRGGLLVADLLGRAYGGITPVSALWADRRSDPPEYENRLNQALVEALASDWASNILVVDDISRTGATIVEAKKFLRVHLPEKEIRNAVLFAGEAVVAGDDVDYVVSKRPRGLLMPFASLG